MQQSLENLWKSDLHRCTTDAPEDLLPSNRGPRPLGQWLSLHHRMMIRPGELSLLSQEHQLSLHRYQYMDSKRAAKAEAPQRPFSR